MQARIEASVSSLPWVSRAELSKLKDEVEGVRRELNGIRSEIKALEERVSRGEGVNGRIKELRDALDLVRSKVASVEGRVKSLAGRVERAEAVIELSVMVGSWKAETCVKGEGGVCKAWRLGKEAADSIARMYGGDAVVKDGEIWRVKVSKVSCLCTFCPLYELRGRE